MRVAARVVDAFRDEVSIGPQRIHLAASIGVAWAPPGGVTEDELVRRADTAMFKAKAAGMTIAGYGEEILEPAVKLRHASRQLVPQR
jgi:GGDEF domain-containing protein